MFSRIVLATGNTWAKNSLFDDAKALKISIFASKVRCLDCIFSKFFQSQVGLLGNFFQVQLLTILIKNA